MTHGRQMLIRNNSKKIFRMLKPKQVLIRCKHMSKLAPVVNDLPY